VDFLVNFEQASEQVYKKKFLVTKDRESRLPNVLIIEESLLHLVYFAPAELFGN
jgi:hypothetical protein